MAWFEYGTHRIYFEAQGTGTPVLVLPGLFVSIEEFSGLRDALVSAGYQVIAADLPGSGRSEPQPRAYTVSYYEEDAYAFAALLQHLTSEPVHLLGFSNGGDISLLMAALIPGVVRSVVTWGVAGALNDPNGQLREAMYNVVDLPIPSHVQFRDYLITTYGEANARAMTQSMVAAMSDIMKQNSGEISRSKADKITCPALLIVGEHDIFAPPALASLLAERIPAAEMLMVEGAEHFVYMDRPEWLAHTILNWLSKH
jgi:valacyclovir hydrolase